TYAVSELHQPEWLARRICWLPLLPQLTRLVPFTASAQVTPQVTVRPQLTPLSSAEFSLRPCVSAAGLVLVWPLRVRSWLRSFPAVVCKKRQTPGRLRR